MADETQQYDRAHSDVCDRRLSRAARQILQRHVLPLLLHHSTIEIDDDSSSLAPTQLYQALEHGISPAKLDTCLLNPNRDIYRHHETNSIKTHTGPSFRLPYKDMRHAYTCGICGKIFMSRYYLDVHLDKHHSSIDNNNNWTCPAVSWCKALGGWGACQQEALDLEPYYGRGSGGYGMDASKVRHEWYRIAHSWRCDEQEMAKSQEFCKEMMASCFDSELATDITHAVCEGLTCQDALHKLLGMARRHVHTWKEEWNMHKGHSLGIGGMLLVSLLVLFYASKGLQRLLQRKRRVRSGKLNSRLNLSVKKRLEQIKNKSKLQ